MDDRNDIIKTELLTVSPALAKMARVKVFAVPPLYFEQLPQDILNKIQCEVNTLSIPASINPYTVPVGYFNNLADTILQKINVNIDTQSEVTAELEIVAPLLNTLSKKMPYAVPSGYFENIQPASATKSDKKARGFTIIRGVYRFAAAAAVIGILVMGAYLFMHPKSASSNKSMDNITAELEKVTDKEIANYLDNNNFAVDVSTLNMYLNEDLPIQEYIRNLSEDEIKRYLKDNGALKKEI